MVTLTVHAMQQLLQVESKVHLAPIPLSLAVQQLTGSNCPRTVGVKPSSKLESVILSRY